MNLQVYKKFKSIFGCLLIIGLLFAGPTYALQQDSVATDSVETTVEGEEAVTTEEAASEEGAATSEEGSAAAPAASTSAAAATADEGSTIAPQVYKNFFYYVLLFLVICAVTAVIGKIHSVYVLTRKMNGTYDPLENNNFQSFMLFLFLFFFLWGTYYSFDVWGSWAWRDAVTEHGKDVDTMFIITTTLTTAVLVIMHILIFTFTLIYRQRKDRVAYFYPHNDTIERIWTIVPATVLTVLVLFGFFTWRSITNVPEELQKSAIQIEVLGEQFAWHVRYPGNDGVIGKRNYKMTTPTNPYGIDFNDKNSWDDIQGADIVIPVNKSVRFHIISKDIIHSFYIPDFRVQINAVPGMTNYFQFTPTVTTEEMRDRMNDPNYDYVMLCNKICGSSHYNMQKRVVVVTEEEYKEWLSKQNKWFSETLQQEFAHNQTEDTNEALASIN